MHIGLIVNPFATRVTEASLEGVVRELERVGRVDVALTNHPHHATELAEASEADFVLVFSGDGGYNEALNGHLRDEPMGFIPGGGTSVLPHLLGLPREPLSAARRLAAAIEHGRTRRISLGRVNGRRFAFNAGVGVDAEVVRRVDRLRRQRNGERPKDSVFLGEAVKLALARRLRLEDAVEVTWDERVERAAFAVVANGDPYVYVRALPLHLTPPVELEQGLAFAAPTSVRARRLPELLRWLRGDLGEVSEETVLRGADLDLIEVRADSPLPTQCDGEDLGDFDYVRFEAERAALTVLV